MRVKTVSAHYERKLNLGDFNSVTVGCTLWADIDFEDDLDKSMRDLWGMAKANVKAQVLPLVQKQAAQVQQIYLGLPVELTGQPVDDDYDDDYEGEDEEA